MLNVFYSRSLRYIRYFMAWIGRQFHGQIVTWDKISWLVICTGKYVTGLSTGFHLHNCLLLCLLCFIL